MTGIGRMCCNAFCLESCRADWIVHTPTPHPPCFGNNLLYAGSLCSGGPPSAADVAGGVDVKGEGTERSMLPVLTTCSWMAKSSPIHSSFTPYARIAYLTNPVSLGCDVNGSRITFETTRLLSPACHNVGNTTYVTSGSQLGVNTSLIRWMGGGGIFGSCSLTSIFIATVPLMHCNVIKISLHNPPRLQSRRGGTSASCTRPAKRAPRSKTPLDANFFCIPPLLPHR